MRLFSSLMAIFMSSSAMAVTVTPIEDSEFSGGATCVIVNKEGKVLIDERIKIDGKWIELQKKSFTQKSKSWSGPDTLISFTLGRGKVLESSDGGFSVGKTPAGKLVILHKGASINLVAHEECYGSD